MTTTAFKLTYASMFDPPEELHEQFDRALTRIKSNELGKTHPMLIDNRDVNASGTFENRSPINRQWLLGHVQAGTREHANPAGAAARAPLPRRGAAPRPERNPICPRAAPPPQSAPAQP